jgi:hypothetical protein
LDVRERKQQRGWIKFHNFIIHNLYPSPNITMIKLGRMTWAGHVRWMEVRNACRMLVGKREGKRLLGGPG